MEKQTDVMIVLKNLEKEVAPHKKKISSLEVHTKEDFELAGKLMKNIKEVAKRAKEREETFTVPLNKLLKDTRDLFRPFRNSIDELEADTKLKMAAFLESQKAKARQLEQDFADGKIKKISTVVSKTNALEVTSQHSQIRKVWTAIEVDASLTPREFMVPDVAKIKEALKEGRKVKGWEWRQVESIAI